MAAQQPGIVHRDDERYARRKFRQKTQIEIVPVQIVRVNDLRLERCQLEQLARAGVMKRFAAAPPIDFVRQVTEPRKLKGDLRQDANVARDQCLRGAA